MGFEFRMQKTLPEFELSLEAKVDTPVLGVFGPSGAGKSSLLAFLAGLDPTAKGYLKLDGEVLFDSSKGIHVPAHERRIALVFQDQQLFPHMSVRKNLLYGHRSKEAVARSPETVIDVLDLSTLLDRKPQELSGGEKQRVALGRSLLCGPRLLLLDEPLSSLDSKLRQRILAYLRGVRDTFCVPMLFVSHSLSEILELSNDLLVIESGKKLAQGKFLEIIRERPVLDMAESLGFENILDVVVEEVDEEKGLTIASLGTKRLAISWLGARVGEQLYLSLRPEDVSLALAPVHGTSIQNQIEAKVIALWPAGIGVMVQVDLGQSLLVEVSRKASRDLELAPGKRVFCLIKARALKVLSSERAVQQDLQGFLGLA